MTKTIHEQSVHRLAAALAAHHHAKTDRSGENPYQEHDLSQMVTAGLRSDEKHPAKNMVAAGDMGLALEEGRIEALAQDKKDKSAKRMARARQRAERKIALDAIADSPVQPSTERMKQAWLIVLHLNVIIDKVANGKRRWASRFLGTTMDDVPQMAKEKTALMLAKSDKDLDLLGEAARQLGEQAKRTGMIPGDQKVDLDKEERKHIKRVRKARGWLMGVVNNRVMGALVDAYTNERNLRWENIDIIATVMASINGPGEDPLGANFKAGRAPAFLGTKFQRPGGVDAALLATAINAAITERGLDRLVELLLANTRTDGAFPWSEMAEDVFMATTDGEWKWQVVVEATTGRNRDGETWTMDRARKARGDFARQFVRAEFAWLPGFILGVLDAFDPKAIGWSTHGTLAGINAEGERVRLRPTAKVTGPRAVLASDFELFYLPDAPEGRELLRPTLKFASSQEAAEALIEHLAMLVTGEDLVVSARNA